MKIMYPRLYIKRFPILTEKQRELFNLFVYDKWFFGVNIIFGNIRYWIRIDLNKED